jgi:CheY-like chemotaxis protein
MSTPTRILVIEDNEENLALVDYLLGAHGFTTILARSGPAGLERAIADPPELILLDIRLPELDGYQVAAAIRKRPELAATPIVAVTASAMVGDRERIAAAGFDGYIPKPIDPETFIAEIERFLPAGADRMAAS